MPCQCSSCRSESLRMGLSAEKCSFCTTELTKDQWYQFIGDRISCEPCYKNNYKVCRICGKTHLHVDMAPEDINFRGETISVCKKCASTQFKSCNGCDKLHYKGDLTRQGDEQFCHDCWTARFENCGLCRSVFAKGECNHKVRNPHGGTEISACKKCWNWHGPIVRYEHTNYLEMKGIGNTKEMAEKDYISLVNRTRFYGIELECVVADGVKAKRGPKAQEVLESFEPGFVVMKEDRSVMELSGFEICTAPATFAYQKDAWGKFFDKLPTNLASYSQEMCGLHIHCSRKPLSLLTIAKMLVFINNAENKAFVECIAGRPANHYCRVMKKKHSDVGLDNRGMGRGRQHEDRHEAINLMNQHTVEFRIFKGTLKRESFFKALEFCDALIHFCQLGENSIKHCQTVGNYIDYVQKNRKYYPHLWAFICARWPGSFKKQSSDMNWMKKYGFGSLDNEI